MLPDPDEEEPLEVALVLILPTKEVVPRPDRARQSGDVDRQPGLLRNFPDQSLLIGLGGLHSSTGRVPERRAILEMGTKEQNPTGAVDDERSNRLAHRRHGLHEGQRLPRAACSRSIDSNSALKLPLPKPLQPLR